MTQLKTQRRLENEARWRAIYADFQRLNCCGAMKMPIYGRLAKKYGLKNANSVCRIVQRMRKEEAA